MIHEITEQAGRYRKHRRIGRGVGSGRGKTAGRGHKGARSRSGATGSIRASTEGGQMPLFRRIPKRGFSNARFRTVYAVVNLRSLEARFDDGAEVNAEMLVKLGLLDNPAKPVKILGDGEIQKKLDVTAAAFSKSAREKIEQAGGKATVSD